MTVHGDGHRRFELPGSMPHYGPDKKVDVLHIDLELRPDLARQRLDAVCTTTVAALDEAVSSLELDAVDLAVESVQCDKRPLSFVHRNKRLEIAFDPPIAPGKQASFAVAYHVVRPRHGLFFIAPSPEYPDRVPHAWTQSQDENARYWFPCFDHPGEKQTTSATVVVPRGQFALSNGALIERRDDGETTIFRYEQDVPHSTYLVTLVVGPFVERQQRGGERPIFFYVLPGREGDGERAFGATPKMMDVFEKRLGVTYPYSRYSQIAVSEFIFGGMENTSATTQTDRTLHDERAHLDFSSDSLVSHELAHQWFGDLLTTRDWSHAWLNEGFATFFEAVYREADLGYDEYLYDIFGQVARYLDEDASRYRRPIVYNHYRDPIELFDRHLYEKGGAVLHMLRGELGEARFWRSIRRYVADNAQRSVETIDLVRAIERATGRNTRAFFDQWVFRGGHPELKVTVEFDKDRKALSARIEQMQTVDDSHPAFAFSVELGVCPKPGEERRIRIRVERQLETLFLPMEEEPHLVRFDPGAFVLADVTYKFGARLAAAALQHDSDCVARIRAARELAKDGSRTARDALERALAEESFWGVAAEIADALGGTRAPWALELLTKHAAHSHPKVRRAVAAALGHFRNAEAAEALLPRARDDASYFVRASALHALGRTRDPRAFDVLSDGIATHSWNGVIESGAARGLGELADERATPLLLEAAKLGHEESLRRAAIDGLARLAALVESQRRTIVDALGGYLDDPMFLVQLSAVAAAERLEDIRLVEPLTRLGESAFDGRVRRNAADAAIRIREGQRVPSQVSALRSELDTLREEYRKLEGKLDEISTHR